MQIWGNAVIPSLSAQPDTTWCRRDALLPDASADLVLCTHSGSRSPVLKTYNGQVAGVFCYNSGGDSWGGNWFTVLLVAPVEHGTQALYLQAPQVGVANNPVLFTYRGKEYYANTLSMNSTWGGVPDYDGYNNTLSLPEMFNIQVFAPNVSNFLDSARIPVGQLLGLH